MAELMKDQIEKMTAVQIVSALRRAAKYQREHIVITWEHGCDLVNICAIHGDFLADKIEASPEVATG